MTRGHDVHVQPEPQQGLPVCAHCSQTGTLASAEEAARAMIREIRRERDRANRQEASQQTDEDAMAENKAFIESLDAEFVKCSCSTAKWAVRYKGKKTFSHYQSIVTAKANFHAKRKKVAEQERRKQEQQQQPRQSNGNDESLPAETGTMSEPTAGMQTGTQQLQQHPRQCQHTTEWNPTESILPAIEFDPQSPADAGAELTGGRTLCAESDVGWLVSRVIELTAATGSDDRPPSTDLDLYYAGHRLIDMSRMQGYIAQIKLAGFTSGHSGELATRLALLRDMSPGGQQPAACGYGGSEASWRSALGNLSRLAMQLTETLQTHESYGDGGASAAMHPCGSRA